MVTKEQVHRDVAFLLSVIRIEEPDSEHVYKAYVRIQDYLEKSQPVPEWQPIETAPKDGTFILLAGPSGYVTTPIRVSVGRYNPVFRPHCPWQTHSDDPFTDGGDEATHWMPLPAAPKPEEDASNIKPGGYRAEINSAKHSVSKWPNWMKRAKPKPEGGE